MLAHCHDTLLVKKLPRVKRDCGYYLRVFRATYGFSQAEAAAFFGVGVSHWSLVEAGLRNFSPTKAFQIAAVIGSPPELLMGVDNGRKPR